MNCIVLGWIVYLAIYCFVEQFTLSCLLKMSLKLLKTWNIWCRLWKHSNSLQIALLTIRIYLKLVIETGWIFKLLIRQYILFVCKPVISFPQFLYSAPLCRKITSKNLLSKTAATHIPHSLHCCFIFPDMKKMSSSHVLK